MPASVIAAARTPWAPRHTLLADVRPERLLSAALCAAIERADIEPTSVARVLVACDTGVGAQDLNLARRAVLAQGWDDVPALTVDGHGTAGLGLVEIACGLDGITVVAGIDASSMVPPGAGLVRDYGRPTLDEPDQSLLEALATSSGLTAESLDEIAAAMRAASRTDSPAITPIDDITSDGVFVDDGDGYEPLTGGGVVTARHAAPYADGAVAIVVGSQGSRALTATLSAGAPATTLDRVAGLRTDALTLLATTSAVEVACTPWARPAAVPSPLAVGSAPSCDGLRMLADAHAMVDEPCTVVTRGGHGQIATASLGPG